MRFLDILESREDWERTHRTRAVVCRISPRLNVILTEELAAAFRGPDILESISSKGENPLYFFLDPTLPGDGFAFDGAAS